MKIRVTFILAVVAAISPLSAHAAETISTPPVSHSFLANAYTSKTTPDGLGTGWSAYSVQLISISADGTLTSKDLNPKKDRQNLVIASGKNGFVVHSASLPEDTFSLSSYLYSNGSYSKAGIKTTYIEPGVLDNKNQYIYGRSVADSVISSRIVSQSVKTGALRYIFETKKNGGGSVCGVATDNQFQRGYFTHLLPNKTVLYSLDLNNGKYKKVSDLAAGFCIDTVIDKNRFGGVSIDIKANSWDSKSVKFIDLSQPKNLISLQVPFTLKWIAEHQMVVAGEYLYLLNPFDDQMMSDHYYIDLKKPLGAEDSLTTIPAEGSLAGRYSGINYLPLDFIK